VRDWFRQSKVVSPIWDGQKFLQKQGKMRGVMGTYRLTEDAKSDLIRIYHHGLHEYGEDQADTYFNAFF